MFGGRKREEREAAGPVSLVLLVNILEYIELGSKI